MNDPIINKVANSALTTLDLEEYYPSQDIVVFDLKDHLYMELILKEKEFRNALASFDWSQFTGKIVAVHCSTDAIVPVWAYMLVASYLQPYASDIYFGDATMALQNAVRSNLHKIDVSAFADQRIVVKGCGDKDIGPFAYLEITKRLRPVVKSIMYGEPCSTVPIYKKKI